MRWLRRLLPDRGLRRVPLAEPMEPRLLYSADLTAGLMLATSTATAAPEVRTLTTTGEYASATAVTDSTAAAANAYASASLAFEANAGQAAEGVDFSAYGSGYGIALDGGQAALTLVTADGQRTVTLQLQDAAAAPQGEGQGLLATRSNVIVGADASQWATGLSNYASVLYRGVYDGVDLRYYGNQRQLEYDFIVAPGANAAQIALRFDGVGAASVAEDGDLVLQVAGTSGEVRFRAPVSYQRAADGSIQAVASRYELRDDGSIGFVLGDYDASRELVIDPVLSYASYFGTAGNEDAPAVAVDASGNVYITGRTNSNAAPLGGSVGSGTGSGDIYVAKFSPDLSTLLFSTRIGGNNDEQGNAIAVDANGNIVVTGWTTSGDFPTLAANDASRSGSQDAVLFKLNASGGLVFGTYIGGTGTTDEGRGVAVDGSGNIYVTGQTTSSGLLDPVLALLLGSSDNAFVEKYSASGSLLYHKELGGGSVDWGTGIALGASGDVFVVGNTQSSNMNVTGGEQGALRGTVDGFLAHLDASGNTLYQSYIGGTDADTVTAVATDGTGKAYVVGVTRARAGVVFTTTTGAYQTTALVSNADTGFLRIYDTTRTGSASLQYSTYIGGSGTDLPSGVALYGGDVVVVGRANSTTDFPITADAVQSTNTGNALYLLQIRPGGAGTADLRYGTFYAAGLADTGNAVQQGNRIYTAGQITSSNWATTGSYDTARQGNDAFVAVFTLANTAPVLNGVVQPPSIAEDEVGNAGVLVSSLVAGQITDADPGAVQGIAVVASDTTHGSWEYTLDGSTWQALSAPSASSALLLASDAQTRVRFVPATDYNGTVTAGLTLRAWDRTTGIAGTRANITSTGGITAFSTASFGVNVTVTPVNDAPVATADSFTTAEDTAITINLADLLANDSDLEGGTLTVVSVANGTGGTVVLNGGGTVKFTPNANFNGTATFSYVISDGAANSLPGTVTITVTPVNDAPVANEDSGTTNEDTPITFTAAQLLGNDTDVEGSALTIASVSGTGAVLNPDGSVTFTPAANFNGTTSFNYRISDGTTISQSGKVVVVVNPVNDAPVAVADSLGAVSNTPITYTAAQLLGNDTDVDGDAMTIGAVTSGSGGTVVLNANGTVTFTPTAGFAGNASFSYTAKDASLSSVPATVTVRVNDVPVAVADTVSATEDAPVTYAAAALLGNDTDVVGNPLVITGVASGSGGTAVLNADGSVTFTPIANFNGPTSFSYTVSDGSLVSSPGTVTVNVAPVNDAPTNTGPITLPGVPEDGGPVTITQAQLLANASDIDGDVLSVVNLVASSGSLVANGNGTWSFTPGANANGPVSFTYDVSDGFASVAAAARLDVAAVNDAPVRTAGSVADLVAAEDSGSTSLGLAGLAYGPGGASDEAAQVLAYTVTAVPAASLGLVTLADGTAVTTGSYTLTQIQGMRFQAAPDANGSGTFSFTVQDDGGGSDTLLQTLQIVVTPVNDTPVRTGGTVGDLTVAEDSASASLGLGTLAFAPGGGSDEAAQGLSYTVSAIPPAALGVVTLADGTAVTAGSYTLAQIQGMRFQAAPDAGGSGTFTFEVKDSGGGADTLTQRLQITVTPVNDPPVRVAGTVVDLTVPEDSGSTPLGLAGLAFGAGGGADEAGQVLTFTVTAVPAPALGVVTLADGTVVTTGSYTLAQLQGMRFQAAADANGTGSFAFTVQDSGGGADTLAQVLNITVTPVNDAPVLTAGGTTDVTVGEDSGSTSLGLGSLAYGPGGGADEAAQVLAYTVTAVPASTLGVVTLADGTVVTTGSYSLAQIQGMRFQAAADANGVGTFSFTVQDDGGGTDTLVQGLQITVTPVNDTPVRVGGSVGDLTVAEDSGSTSLGLGGLVFAPGGASDEAAQVLTYTVTAVPPAALGWVTLADGTVVTTGAYTLAQIQGMRFQAAADATGSGTFAFAVQDDGGGADTLAQSLAITVTPVNDAPVRIAGTVGDLTLAEDSVPASLGLAGLAFAPGGAGDEAAQVLAYTVTSVPPAALGFVTLADGTVVGTGSYTLAQIQGMRFQAAADANGVGAFSFSVQDDGGGTDTLVQALQITVTPVNDPPVRVAGSVGNLTVPEDSGSTSLGLGGLVFAPGGASDEAAQVLTYTVTAVPAAALGAVTLADGTVVTTGSYTLAQIQGMRFLAAADATGSGTLAFTVRDDAGSADTLVQSLDITVTAVNDTPVRTAGNVTDLTIAEDTGSTSLGLGALAFGNGGGTDEAAQVLAYTVTSVPPAALGFVTLADGTVVGTGSYTLAQIQGMRFQAAADANGVGTFSFTVKDDGGGADTLAQSLQITVTPVNDAPVRTGGTVGDLTVAEDSGSTSLGLGGLAFGPGGSGEEASQALTYRVTALPPSALGTVTLADGTVVTTGSYTLAQIQGMRFQTAADAFGAGTFSFAVQDDGGGADTLAQTLQITVTPVNDAPTTTVVTLPAMQEDGGTITITSAQLLANAGDVEGDPLSIASLSASSGMLVANGNGTWSYTPAANANGAVVFTYGITDGTATVAGTANLQVVPVNDPPTTSAVVLPGMAEDSGAVTITVAELLANAADVDGNALSVGNLSASSGTLVANGNGSWTFTPARDFNGVVAFSYTVSDGSSSASGSATLQVAAVDDTPQITSDGGQGSAIVSIPENTQLVTTVTASDVDTAAQALVFGIAGGADAALFTIDGATGALAFARMPDFEAPADANGDNVYEVVVQVSDGTSSGRQALAVRVTDVQDAVATLPAPSPATAPAPAVPAPAPISSPVVAPDSSTTAPVAGGAASDTRGNRTAESLQEALGPTMATPLASFNSTEVSFATSPARIALAADPTHVFRTVVFDRGGVELISAQADDQLVLARFGIDSRPDGTRLDDFQRTLRSAAFANQLDRLRQSVRDDLDLDKSIDISVVSVSLGLSLVYVLWLIRGGVLIGSYLSALPAWRLLDPLPVLSRVEDEDDEEEPLEGGRRDGRDTLRGFG